MCVFLTINSLRISFLNSPAKFIGRNSLFFCGNNVEARIGRTAPFIVMETLTLSRGMPSKRTFMSSIESMATPAFPTSPVTLS